MNINDEKIKLIKLVADIENEAVLKKLKKLLTTKRTDDVGQDINPAMADKLQESRKQIKAGKGIKLRLDNIWE